MRKNKRLLVFVLSILTFVCAFFGACELQKDLTIKTTDPKITYFVGQSIDVYDYFEEEKGVEYSFEVTYIDAETNTASEATSVKGRTYCATVASRYTLTIKAKRNYSKAEKSVQFDVCDVKPTVFISGASQIYELGETYISRVMLGRLGAIVVSDTDYEMWIDQVSFQESALPSITTVKNTNEKEVTKFEKNTDGSFQFTFDKAGEYEFTLAVENAGGVVYNTFMAKVLSEPDISTDLIADYYNAEFGKDEQGEYNSVIKLYGSPDLLNASYAVVDEDYTAGQVARVEFYGKNLPSYIGLLGVNEEGSSTPYDLYEGQGFVLAMEQTNANYPNCLYGPTRLGEGTRFLKRPTIGNPDHDIERWGFQDLEADKHYSFEFTIKALGTPFVDEATGKMKSPDFGMFWRIYEINDVTGEVTLVAKNASHYESYVTRYDDVGYFTTGTLVFYSSISKDVTFKYYEDTLMDFDESDYAISYDEETKLISWDEVEGANYYLVKVNDNEKTVPATTTSLSLTPYLTNEDFQNYSVVVKPSIGYNDYLDKQMEYGISISPEGYEDMALYKGTLDKDTNTVTLNGGGIANTTKLEAISALDNAFIAFKGEYGLNTRVDVWFTGNNMPQICLFADTLSGNMANGKGVLFTNGFTNASGTALASWCKRYTIYGPNKINAKLDEATPRIHCETGTANNKETNTNDLPNICADALDATTNYKYSVWTYAYSDGNVEYIRYKVQLWTVAADGTETRVYAYENAGNTNKVLTSSVTAGNILLYAGVKGDNNATTFTYAKPYAVDNQGNAVGTEDSEKPDNIHNGTVDETTKTVVLNGGGIANTTKLEAISALDNGYFAIKGKYGLNTRVDVWFTGNNMPQICLFADTLTGDMTSGKGVLFTNGFTDASGTALASWCKRYTIYGPNKINAKIDEATARIHCETGTSNNKVANANDWPNICADALDANTNYKYSVWTYAYTDSGVEYIRYKVQLWSIAEDGTETRLYAFENVGNANKVQTSAVSAGHILFYAGVKGSGSTTTFTYAEPYAVDNSGNKI